MHRLICVESVLLKAGKAWMGSPGFWQFLLVVQGEATCSSMQPTVPVFGGDVLASHPAGGLVVVNNSANDLRAQVLMIEPSTMRVLMTERHRRAMDSMQDRHHGQRLLSPSHPSTAGLMRALLGAIPGSAELPGVAVRIMNCLLEQLQLGVGGEGNPMEAVRIRLRDIVESLRPMDCRDLSVWSLAQECGCTPRQLNGLLREEYGCTLVELKNNLRLRWAEELLKTSHNPIGQIAVAAGFANNGVFSALFQRRYGMSPSNWRLRTAAGGSAPHSRRGSARRSLVRAA
jgi:AraC-like DNA-binding protein